MAHFLIVVLMVFIYFFIIFVIYFCYLGKIKLEDIPEYPDELKELFIGTYPGKWNFLENIRSINSSLAFGSVNTQRYEFGKNNRGPYCYKIYGQIQHKINTSLYACIDEESSNGQLFIIDSQEAQGIIAKKNPKVNQMVFIKINCFFYYFFKVLKKVETFLRENNPIAQSYIMMEDEQREQQRISALNNVEPPQLKLVFTQNIKLDERVYNTPRANEVAAVFVPNAQGLPPQIQIVVHEKSKKELTMISNTHPHQDAYHIPIAFSIR